MSLGGRYQGETKNQARHGVGVYLYPNRFFRYEGEWRDGKKHGTGKLILGDGGYYEGAFIEGEIEGNGERLYGHSGARYVGHFIKGERHGLGRYEGSDGSSYEGNWFYNRKEGYGSGQEADGGVYEGEWHNNVKHGEGLQVSADGSKYEGGWVNGMRHGHGKLQMADKSVYEGQWKNDMYHGQGTLKHCSGIVRICPWVKGKPFSQPVAFMFQSKKNARIDHGKPITFSVAVVDNNGNTFEEESGRLVELRVARRGKPGEDPKTEKMEWLNLLVRKTSDYDHYVHTSRSTPNTPFSSGKSLSVDQKEEAESPFKMLAPAPTVKGFVSFRNVYLPTFPSDLKDKAFNKLNNVKAMIDKVMIFENPLTVSDGDEAGEALSDTNLLRNKSKGKRVDNLKVLNRRNSMRTEENKRDNVPPRSSLTYTAVDGAKTPKFALSEDLTIGAFDATEDPFALRISAKHHPVYSGTPSLMKLLK